MPTIKVQNTKINSRSNPRLNPTEKEELRDKLTRIIKSDNLNDLTVDEQKWARECERRGKDYKKEAVSLFKDAFPETTKIPLTGNPVNMKLQKSAVSVSRLGDNDVTMHDLVEGMALNNRNKLMKNPISRMKSGVSLDKYDSPTHIYALPTRKGLHAINIKGAVTNPDVAPVAMSQEEYDAFWSKNMAKGKFSKLRYAKDMAEFISETSIKEK